MAPRAAAPITTSPSISVCRSGLFGLGANIFAVYPMLLSENLRGLAEPDVEFSTLAEALNDLK
jgi:hypothetical protein